MSVIAVEPNPDMAFRLKQNLKINNFERVHVCQVGASAKKERISLGLPYKADCEEYHNPGTASMVQMDRAVRLIEVECEPIDDILLRLNFSPTKVGLVKMDIEGKELDALHGMKSLLSAADPAVIIEYNKENFDECKVFLEKYGFVEAGSLVSYGIDNSVRRENICFLKPFNE